MLRLFKNKLIVLGVFIVSISAISFILKNSTAFFTGESRGEKLQPIYSVKTDQNVVSLTFDINWAEKDYIDDILAVLDKYNAKGTFFVMGKWVNYPKGNVEKLKKICENGHEIGNHSYVHPEFTKIDKQRMADEIKKTENIIYDTVGVKTNLFRCPSGAYNDKAISTIESMNYKCIQWDVDSVDWKQDGKEIEYNRVIKKIKPGSIILFHNNAKYTPENLERILKKLKDDNYKVVTVGEIIYKESYKIDRDGKQYLIK